MTRAWPIVMLLVCLVPRLGLAADWKQAQQVTVVTTEYRFSPNRLTLEHGQAYQLHVVNRGKEQHEFTAPEFFKSAEIGNPATLNADNTEIEIPPGMSKDLLLVPQRPGRYKLRCSDHDWAGMVGEIVVK